MVYKWKQGAVVKADANIAGEVCEGLRNTVGLTKKNLVDASRAEDAPLHGVFEWDDTIAAEAYRETQAGYIIRSLEVEIEETKNEPVRAFFVTEQGHQANSGFDSIRRIMAEPVKRNSLLDIALSELRAFQKKYRMLTELADVFTAIDAVIGKESA